MTTEPRFRDALTLLEKPAPTAEELLDGFHSIHALYVQTHPRSDLSQLDYARQAEHFIAEACLVCLSPIYEEAKVHHLAQKAAMYCCMARTCAGIKLPFADAQFGYALLVTTICFVSSIETTLAEARRVLRPGGCIKLRVRLS